MQFLILFPFPSPASIPRCLINTRELCFPSQARGLPARSTGAVGTPPSPPALLGAPGQAGCALGWGCGDVPGPGSGRRFPFQALGMHNSWNRRLGMKRFKLASGTGMKSMEPAASSSRAYRSPGKRANCSLELMRLRVHRRVFMGGQSCALPAQPCATGSEHGGC